jgi:hypothetical protein
MPSSSAAAGVPAGFVVTADNVEGGKTGLFFFGSQGRQANPWGNPVNGCSSFQCVVPPVKRGGIQTAGGTPGACDGTLSQDLNTYWQFKPGQNPGPGATVQVQAWFRDSSNTCPVSTSLTNALEVTVCP